MHSDTLVRLINDLLNWQDDAIKILGDYLEDCGFGRELERHGGLYSRIGVVRALLNTQIIDLPLLSMLDLPDDEVVHLQHWYESTLKRIQDSNRDDE